MGIRVRAVEADRLAKPLLASIRYRRIHRDTDHPDRQRNRATVAADALDDVDHGLAHHVRRVVTVPHHAQHNVAKTALVLFKQATEGRTIPLHDVADELGLAGSVHGQQPFTVARR